ncbi:hypothetical protein [Roseateles sp.]|uniref:hypothetical protein n=1 Tax=Roseateles sp. TaxID=1971397 RepID=UPI0025F05626|nr:hypothetical protein [Roseateles sp.]MBV8037580.1 hypothetical protein [Roseateles sp.]
MLRRLLWVAALTVCAAGLVAFLAGHRGAAPFALWGGVIAAAVLLERWRYRAHSAARDDDWQKTDERFIDPESGRPMQVFYNPRTGERRYEHAPDGGEGPHG